jgi:hypothetical protein
MRVRSIVKHIMVEQNVAKQFVVWENKVRGNTGIRLK